ncbi:hypothetical protein C5167_002891 [Papaver somniferum]|uniref:Bifunctional inhibitor/plant lipid transfer protein/seed storage helical domain-containing protein n=1 Tax=Papaver somniferum TaxID=3469 RepID=A0A4Y7KUJ4_PAPSO|nr:uncharacterized protein LOC113308490 [Papaver somniferum]RZC76082.1 hypothetical protein C5167_002891 [Papaver somniferum]
MAILKVHCFLIILIVMVGFVTSRNLDGHDKKCPCQRQGLVDMLRKCEKYLSTELGKALVQPDGDCCAAVRSADVKCLLKYVGYMEGIVSREKVVYVNEYCNTINTGHHKVLV